MKLLSDDGELDDDWDDGGYLGDDHYHSDDGEYYSESEESCPGKRELRTCWEQLSQTSWKSFSEAQGNIIVCRDSLEPNHSVGEYFYSLAERVTHVILLLKYLKKFMERYRSDPKKHMAYSGHPVQVHFPSLPDDENG